MDQLAVLFILFPHSPLTLSRPVTLLSQHIVHIPPLSFYSTHPPLPQNTLCILLSCKIINRHHAFLSVLFKTTRHWAPAMCQDLFSVLYKHFIRKKKKRVSFWLMTKENIFQWRQRALIQVKSWFLKISLTLKCNSDSNNALCVNRWQQKTSSALGYFLWL